MTAPQPITISPPTRPKAKGRLRRARWLLYGFGLFYVLPVMIAAGIHLFTVRQEHWSRADRSSIGIAPDPAQVPEALVHVYAARAYGWRGIFAQHIWIALKPHRAKAWERFEVIGFGVSRGRRAVRISSGAPDTRWFGHDPRIIAELRGERAEAVIPRLRAAAADYPYPNSYTAWPGPNSNTFIAYIARRLPELRLDIPANAVGKNYPVNGVFAATPSGSGWQVSLGLAGIAIGAEEGLEIDIIGLSAGFDLNRPALRLPGIGRLGFD